MSDPRLLALQHALLRLAGGDLDARTPVSDAGDDVDAVCVGVNLLAEELRAERARRAQVERALRDEQLAREASERQKMRSLAEFAGGVAHDLNNLLGVMTGVGEGLRSPGDDTDELLDDLDHALKRGTVLTRQLLSLSVDTSRALRADPSEAIRGAVRLARRAAGPQVVVEEDVPDTLPPVRVDPSELARVVLNLVTNGYEALPARGGHLEVAAYASQGHVWVRVRDTGESMDSATLARATEPLFTTKPGGTGFGLALAYALCEQAGGAILIDSEVGRGTEVKLRLPVVASTG